MNEWNKKNKKWKTKVCYTQLGHGFSAITPSLGKGVGVGVGGWGWGVGGLVGKQLNTTIIAFTGATRLKSCVRTHCFYLFDICRVEFIWGNITFLSYIDGSVKERCNSSALAMELRLSCTNPSKYSPQNTKSRLNTFNCWWPGATGSQCISRYLKYHIFSDFFSLGNGNITLFFTSIVCTCGVF